MGDEPKYDVVVVGSGPAGLACAIVAARAGLAVAIIAGPRRAVLSAPTPSEAVHPGIETLLRELGAEDTLIAASRGTYHGIWRDGTFEPLGVDRDAPWIGHHIDRVRFDQSLLGHAIASGAHLIAGGEPVVGLYGNAGAIRGIRTPSAIVHAGHVVDATGRRRRLGRLAGFAERTFSAPLIAWSALIEPFERGATEPRFESSDDGWTWTAPEASGRWTRTWLTAARGGVARRWISDGVVVGKVFGADAQWRLFRPLVTNGLLLVGDAAGVLDPGTGQGVLKALWSGMMGARALIDAIARPALASFALAHYDAWFVKQYDDQRQRLATALRSVLRTSLLK